MSANQQGGEVTIKGVDGRIRAKDTVKPGNRFLTHPKAKGF